MYMSSAFLLRGLSKVLRFPPLPLLFVLVKHPRGLFCRGCILGGNPTADIVPSIVLIGVKGAVPVVDDADETYEGD